MPDRGQRFPGVARDLLRDAALDAALQILVAEGAQHLRMADVAAAVDVSRQTIYAEFGTKQVMLRQLVDRETRGLCAALVAVLDSHAGDPAAAVDTGCALLLRRSRADPLVKTIVSGSADVDLLPLVTTDGAPIVKILSAAFRGYFHQHWPAAAEDGVVLVADVVTRLTISHVLMPDRPVEIASRDIAAVLTPFLDRIRTDAGHPDP
ncbi:TetR family transcriptional regulator [Pseudonocardia kongjuensis]|uniref:TetR family transcriptional regulator n=1 Tax=Pseudonocardia kongjuensis TaxID=102227 RepID=A0ABN1XS10_9PSEU